MGEEQQLLEEQKPEQPETTPEKSGDSGEPSWLPDRLDRARKSERKSVLAELGVDDLGSVKKLLQADAKRRDAEKSAQERLTELESQLKAKSEAYDAVYGEFDDILKAQIEAIPEAHRESASGILDAVGNDPVARMKALRKMQPLFEAQTKKKPDAPDIDAEKGKRKKSGDTGLTEEEVRRRYNLNRR